MKHDLPQPVLPPVVDEYIDELQREIRDRIVSLQSRETLRRRFGARSKDAPDDRAVHPRTALFRTLTGQRR